MKLVVGHVVKHFFTFFAVIGVKVKRIWSLSDIERIFILSSWLTTTTTKTNTWRNLLKMCCSETNFQSRNLISFL